MTTAQIARDASFMITHRPTVRTARPVAADPIIARMDAAQADGRWEADRDGLRRQRRGLVGDADMICQVAALGGDTLFTFWSIQNGYQRRLLADAAGHTWIEVDRGGWPRRPAPQQVRARHRPHPGAPGGALGTKGTAMNANRSQFNARARDRYLARLAARAQRLLIVQAHAASVGDAQSLREAQDGLRRLEATVQTLAEVDAMRGPGEE